MTTPKADPRDAILAWVEQWSYGTEKAAWRAVLDLHQRAHAKDPAWAATWCTADGNPWPCRTIRAIADALGVAT